MCYFCCFSSVTCRFVIFLKGNVLQLVPWANMTTFSKVGLNIKVECIISVDYINMDCISFLQCLTPQKAQVGLFLMTSFNILSDHLICLVLCPFYCEAMNNLISQQCT